MVSLPGYEVGAVLSRSLQSTVYSGRRLSDGLEVVLKIRLDDELTRAKTETQREYAILQKLQGSGTINPIELINSGPSPTLILEKFDGISLSQRLKGEPLSLMQFLNFAIPISETITRIHQIDVLHKDIKPSNILCSPDDREIRVIDFAISVRSQFLAHEDEQNIAGSLPYISPEQTGRMVHQVDQRSDLYSLGVTFFELITGRTPFICSTPLRYVHAHLAVEAPSPATFNSHVPEVIAEIILKLLAKAPEDRYQTSEGLVQDLIFCRRSMQSRGKIDPFPIGIHDVPMTFMLPKTLYGRESQTQALLDAFEKSSIGQLKTLFIDGASGTGKTALVRQVQIPIVKARGRMIEGKFNQFALKVPYMALNQALDSLVDQLLLCGADELQYLREQIQERVGNGVTALLELFPSLGELIEESPPLDHVAPEQAQTRLWSCLRAFFSVVATIEHPLVLFIDDLQWADAGTLGLIEYLMGSARSDEPQPALFVLGAYRTNELVEGSHLQATKEKLKELGALEEITLEPLRQQHLLRLLCDMFHREENEVEELAKIVTNKTGNNPLFITHFLNFLNDSNLFKFDPQLGWVWSAADINSSGIPDDAVVIMQDKIGHLSTDARNLLTKASVIGSTFDIRTLMALTELSPEDLSHTLHSLIQKGLIAPLPNCYRFIHGKIQESCYLMLSESERERLHSEVGQWMLLEDAKFSNNRLFITTDHLNKGVNALSGQARIDLSKLNLQAGTVAIESAAWSEALNYYYQGQSVINKLTESEIYEDEELSFSFEIGITRCLYLLGDRETVIDQCQILLSTSLTVDQRIQVTVLLMESYALLTKFHKCCETGINALRELGLNFELSPDEANINTLMRETLDTVRSLDPLALHQLPMSDNVTWLQQLTIINAMSIPAFHHYKGLSISMTCYAFQRALDEGLNEQVPFRLIGISIIIGVRMGRYKLAYEFGQQVIELSEKIGNKQLHIRGKNSFLVTIPFWVKPIKETIKPTFQLSRQALELGEIRPAMDGMHNVLAQQIISGEKLEIVLRTARATSRIMNQEMNLTSGYADQILKYVELHVSESRLGEFTQCENPLDFFFTGEVLELQIMKVQLLTLVSFWYLCCNETTKCLEIALEQSKLTPELLPGSVINQLVQLVIAISAARELESANGDESIELMLVVHDAIDMMRTWSLQNSSTWDHQIQWIEAEVALSESTDSEALVKLLSAREKAKIQGYRQHACLITQRLVDVYLKMELPRQAGVELEQLCSELTDWGAVTLKRQAREKYLDRVENSTTFLQDSSSASQSATTILFDMDTIIDNSRAISEGRNIESVTRSFLRSAVENAGAQRGVLILVDGDEVTVQAESRVTGEFNIINQPIDDFEDLAHSIIHYVANKGEHVILNEAQREGLFTRDPWITKNDARSILVLPVKHQAELRAILFLSNELAGSVFNRDRLRILDLLGAQAAISLGQAKLYEELEQRVESRTSELLLATEDAKQATQSKSNFLASMSHEIRTPMNGVLGMAQLMAMTELTKEQKEYLEAIRSSGESLLAILNDILDFSKIEAGKMQVDPTSFSLWDCIREVSDIMAPNAQEKSLEFPVIIESSVPEIISTDKTRVSQILLNLINNAVKFTESGQISIKVSIDVKEGDVLNIDIKDTGIGIEPEQAKRLFQPFTQADASTTRRFGGTGLGLSISRHLAELLGGGLTLASTQGEGSKFSVWLPLESPAKKTQLPSLECKLIHVVANNALNRQMIRCLLETLGAKVSESDNVTDVVRSDILFVESEFLADGNVDWLPECRTIIISTWPNRVEVERLAQSLGAEQLTRPVFMRSIVELFGQTSKPKVEDKPNFQFKNHDLKVLLVEDNLVNQRIASAMLRKAGLTCEVASDGIEALEKHAEHPWDVILMDCQMPNMDGYQASMEIRRREQRTGQHAPIIALTANVLEGDKERCLKAGMDAYLPKPLDKSDLYSTIEKYSSH